MPELFVYFQSNIVPLESNKGNEWRKIMRGRVGVIRNVSGKQMMLTLSLGEHHAEWSECFSVI